MFILVLFLDESETNLHSGRSMAAWSSKGQTRKLLQIDQHSNLSSLSMALLSSRERYPNATKDPNRTDYNLT